MSGDGAVDGTVTMIDRKCRESFLPMSAHQCRNSEIAVYIIDIDDTKID